MSNKFVLGEFFCGPGGLALGARLAKTTSHNEKYSITHGWATDFDKDSCHTYTKNICPLDSHSVICKDVRKLDFSLLKKKASIDAFAFGFPCNDFSVVGEQKGMDGIYGPLYQYGVAAIEFFQPKWFIAENVGGLRNSNEGRSFQTILSNLHETGYSIYPHLYRFNEYGVPQSRARVIIVGIRKDIPVVFKIPSTNPYRDIDVSCKTALEKHPISKDTHNNEKTNQSYTVIQRLKHIKPGENAFTANLPARLKLNVNGAKISQIYKRLDPKKPAYTITGSGGGGTHVYHWKKNRALTNRERARLQTFPDNFIFTGSKESVRKQIGMAVPPLGAKVIFRAILKSFAGIKYPYISANIDPILHENHLKLYNHSTRRNLRFCEKEVAYTNIYAR